jgi:hypothetical protein
MIHVPQPRSTEWSTEDGDFTVSQLLGHFDAICKSYLGFLPMITV